MIQEVEAQKMHNGNPSVLVCILLLQQITTKFVIVRNLCSSCPGPASCVGDPMVEQISATKGTKDSGSYFLYFNPTFMMTGVLSPPNNTINAFLKVDPHYLIIS